MGIFDKAKNSREPIIQNPFIRVIKEIYQDENIPIDESEINNLQVPNLYSCSNEGCGYDVIFYFGDNLLCDCPKCGRPVEKLNMDGSKFDLLKKKIASNGEILSHGHLNFGLKLFKEKKYDKALFHLSRAIELFPTGIDAIYNRSEVKIAIGDYSGAIDDCNLVINLDADDYGAYINRGTAKSQLGDYSGALIDYNKALSYEDANPIAFFNRGMTLIKLGQSEEAISDFQKYMELEPNSERTTFLKERGLK